MDINVFLPSKNDCVVHFVFSFFSAIKLVVIYLDTYYFTEVEEAFILYTSI